MSVRLPAVALATIALLAATPAAHAGWKIDRARTIAERIWHNPCAGNVTIRWGNPEDFGALGGAWSYNDPNCEVWLAQDHYWPFYALCTLLAHEYGHLAGAEHNDNPASIMYPVHLFTEERATLRGRRYFTVRGADPRCKDRGRKYLGMRPGKYGWR